MKNIKLFLSIAMVTVICTFGSNCWAQIIKGEVFAGGSVSQVDGDFCYGYHRVNPQVGAGALVPLTNWLDVALEVMYNPKGALKKDSIVYNSSFNGRYDLKLDYVEVPVMFYFTDKGRYTVGLGAAFGRLVGFSEKVHGIESDTRIGDGKLRWKDGIAHEDLDLGYIRNQDDLNNPAFYDSTGQLLIQNSNSYKKNDFSVCADLRIRIWEGLHAQIRYQYSFIPIRTCLYTSNAGGNPIKLQKNNQIALRLTYIFGEDRSKLNKIIQKEERRKK